MKGKKLWNAARLWLEKNSPEGIAKSELSRYFSSTSKNARTTDMRLLYRAILKSLTQAAMTESVIVGAMKDGIDSLALVTFRFSPAKTVKHYGANYETLFSDIKTKVHPNGKLRDEGLWPKYCKTMLATAKFLSQFDTAEAFFVWADEMVADERLRVALPLLLSQEIFGAGFALACNVLIDLGYEEFAKPDRHVKGILKMAKLIDEDATDYQALKAMLHLAQDAKIPPFALDKALFLIGSGSYFLHPGAKAKSVRNRSSQFQKFLNENA
jgi:hypothetical protein